MSSPADPCCIGMASVRARSAATSIRLRGVPTALSCPTGLPRRVMHTGSPAAARSTSSLKCALASARLTLLIADLPDYLPGHLYHNLHGPAKRANGKQPWRGGSDRPHTRGHGTERMRMRAVEARAAAGEPGHDFIRDIVAADLA